MRAPPYITHTKPGVNDGIGDMTFLFKYRTAAGNPEKIEWTYYELWHHQGRRARMGTAMMGPNYMQWHGFESPVKM